MTRIRVFFAWVDGPKDWIDTNDAVDKAGVGMTTRRRLNQLLVQVALSASVLVWWTVKAADWRKESTEALGNWAPVVMAVVQSSNRVSNDTTIPVNATTIEKPNPDIARIRINTAIKILWGNYEIKPTTWDALEFLAELWDELSSIVTLNDNAFSAWTKWKPDLIASSASIAREAYLSLNKTGSPLMQNAKHFLEWTELELRVQSALTLPTKPDILNIRQYLDAIVEKDPDLAESIWDYKEERVKILTVMANEAEELAAQRIAESHKKLAELKKIGDEADRSREIAEQAGRAAGKLLAQLKII